MGTRGLFQLVRFGTRAHSLAPCSGADRNATGDGTSSAVVHRSFPDALSGSGCGCGTCRSCGPGLRARVKTFRALDAGGGPGAAHSCAVPATRDGHSRPARPARSRRALRLGEWNTRTARDPDVRRAPRCEHMGTRSSFVGARTCFGAGGCLLSALGRLRPSLPSAHQNCMASLGRSTRDARLWRLAQRVECRRAADGLFGSLRHRGDACRVRCRLLYGALRGSDATLAYTERDHRGTVPRHGCRHARKGRNPLPKRIEVGADIGGATDCAACLLCV